MGREAEVKQKLFNEIIELARLNHNETIDKAYEYFWDSQKPDEFLSGTALSLGFHNFEDWMVCDYRINDKKECFIDLYLKEHKELTEEEKSVLDNLKNSVLSLHEVLSSTEEDRVPIKDILLGNEVVIEDKTLAQSLKPGDLFATRIIRLDGRTVMSGCVYPYISSQKKAVLHYIDRQFKRFMRNVKQDGTMREYLKDYGDVFNLIWMNFILEPPVAGE